MVANSQGRRERKDPRIFFKLHNGMPEHPKVIGLSDEAFRALVTLWCWSHRNQTDGKVASAVATRLASATAIAETRTSGMLEDIEGGYYLHDYLEHQESRAEVEERIQKRRESGARGGKAAANKRQVPEQVPEQVLQQVPQQNGSKAVADKDEDEDLDTHSSSRSARRSEIESAWETFWDLYPRKVGKQAARKAFARAASSIDPESIVDGAARLANDPNLPDKQFIPHPSTWLNEGRWDDEPLPPRVRNMSGAEATLHAEWQRIGGVQPISPWDRWDTPKAIGDGR